MVIYSVFLTSWTFTYKSNASLSYVQSYAAFKSQGYSWAYGQLPMFSISGYLGEFLLLWTTD